ncbi:MAG: mechanosensitive ion channel family protein [Candidatus Thermoplasmatota archaeon]|nr:mechanosensitive ion channel [Euryarchaeota archaeon]MBU4031744.1 mechanosensitive ion channel family protein [Candidatus Thermoplasmatota archaeon]MBU4071064.1 mechanosensitive ion channel family protein [Candidatus Thermoplasmatota archaeon]MBU4143811.1 mechanosensitive ion channel family protein [Candidatus Thermoplasmatota archaeon]MBU4591596.1 mechanosensitive ion channel family protein [Candidatus Thermoplasmatota archaeon]
MKFKELPGRIFTVTAMIMLAMILWFLDQRYDEFILFGYVLNDYLVKGYITFIALAIIYLIFKIIFEGTLIGSVKEYKARYSFKKVASVLYYTGCLIALTSIWVKNPESLFLAFGLVGAGIAIALQDLFKNFVGGILILTSKIYSVGDRVEIDKIYGDVIDIGVFYTTLMEIRGWVSGDQASGRITLIPNGRVLSSSMNNYTKDHQFIWDEITIPITYDSDWKMAQERFTHIVVEQTKHIMQQAEEGISKIRDKYYAEQVRNLEPVAYLKVTDNWIELSVRYTVNVYERRKVQNAIHRGILEEIARNDKIKIASATFEIVGFPEVKLNSKGDTNV